MESLLKTKQRPSRIFYDVAKRDYYVIQNGKRYIVKVPAKVKNLKDAQDFLSSKLQSKLTFKNIKGIKPEERVYYTAPKSKKLPNIPLAQIQKAAAITNKEKIEEFKKSSQGPNSITTQEIEKIEKLAEEEKKAEDAKAEEKKNRDDQLAAQQQLIQEIKDNEENEMIRFNLAMVEYDRLQDEIKQLPPALRALIPPQPPQIQPPVNPPPPIPNIVPIQPVKTKAWAIDRFNQNKNVKNREKKFKEDIQEFKLQLSDIPNFDSFNTMSHTVNDTDLFYDFIKYLYDSKEADLQKDFNGEFGLNNLHSKDVIIKTILGQITEPTLNDLVSRGKVPARYQYMQGGGKDQDEPNPKNPLPALWDSQIEEYFAAEPQFGGVIAADQIDDLPDKLPMGFIMNLDNEGEPGSHWVAVYLNGDSVEYFDPLADGPSEQFIRDIKKKIAKIPIMFKFKINKIQQQHGASNHCGYHCMRFLDDRFNGLPFALSSRYKTNNSKEGEAVIKEEFKLI